MKQQLLLLEDVDALGKKGEVISAKPGYVRNFLLPQRLAVVANANMLRKQERLRAERAEQAIVDRQKSDELVKQIESITLDVKVKVDPEGHMYGSISPLDVAILFQERGLPVERRNIGFNKPIKETGTHKIAIKLKEGVTTSCQLVIIPEGINAAGIENVVKPIPVESPGAAPAAADQTEADKA